MEILNQIVAWFMSILLSIAGVTSFVPEERAQKLRVTAYLIVNSAGEIDTFDPSHLADLTDLILFGDLAYCDQDEKLHLCENFDHIVEQAKALTAGLDVRLHLNVGFQSGMEIRTMHKQAAHSGRLSDNIKAVLEQYELDGVQFDYEFPFEWQAKYWFSRFLKQLDDTLGDDYMIGIAACPEYARLLPSAIRILDMVEVMCYDNWNDEGFHAPMENAQRDIREMLTMGYRRSQLDMGLPFYARPTTQETVWYDYVNYYDKLDGNGLYRDADRNLTFSFNTPQMIYDKTAWAIEEGLGGVMVWHYRCDVPADHEASLFNAITRAKTDCQRNGSPEQ